MMKRQALFLLALVVAQAFAVPHYQSASKSLSFQQKQLQQNNPKSIIPCGVCIQFAGQAINELLNIILNAGVAAGCSDVCGILADKTKSKIIGEVCDVLCIFVGFEEFVKIVEKADLDPIYYCELLHTCPINDHGDATINSVTITPKSGPQGEFKIDVEYTSKNGTGTGEVVLEIDTVDGAPVGDSELNKAQQAGTYGVSWTLKAEPDSSCDPSQGPCENWVPGVYVIKVAVCNGQCGSKHPHSQIYSESSANFTIQG